MLELAEVVKNLRAEIYEALNAGQDELLRFGVGTIELDLSLVMTREDKRGAKVRFWVLDASADNARTEVTTHQLRLKLEPRFGSARKAPPEIGGPSAPNER